MWFEEKFLNFCVIVFFDLKYFWDLIRIVCVVGKIIKFLKFKILILCIDLVYYEYI